MGMIGAAPEPVGDDVAAATGGRMISLPRRLSEHWCPWCRSMHGFGYCAHASWLTQDALARRGAHFNWR
jgi:hypothetical protein